jgi:hypothetical protein
VRGRSTVAFETRTILAVFPAVLEEAA